MKAGDKCSHCGSHSIVTGITCGWKRVKDSKPEAGVLVTGSCTEVSVCTQCGYATTLMDSA